MTIPADVQAQLQALADGIATELGDDLVGVYLHGSLVLGSFNPQRSDVDVLVVARRAIDDATKKRLWSILRRSSGRMEGPRTPPYPLELSFLVEDHIRPWRYPTPYDLHYSEGVRSYEQVRRGGEDHDLAAHFRIVRVRGVALRGPPPDDVFPEVPEADFVDSLLRDLDWCRKQNWKIYSVLSASRILRTMVEGGLQNKVTGAEWALVRAPAEFRSTIEIALPSTEARWTTRSSTSTTRIATSTSSARRFRLASRTVRT